MDSMAYTSPKNPRSASLRGKHNIAQSTKPKQGENAQSGAWRPRERGSLGLEGA